MSSRSEELSVKSSDTNAWKHAASKTEQHGSLASESACWRVATLLAAFVPCPAKTGIQRNSKGLAILVLRSDRVMGDVVLYRGFDPFMLTEP